MNHTPATPAELYAFIPSPIGELLLCGDEQRLSALYVAAASRGPEVAAGWRRADAAFVRAREQLEAYFDGERVEFELALNLDGATPFCQSVWRGLLGIPFGSTISYGELARQLGKPTGARAVGMANGRNPISIIVPCHRVIGAGGGLTGYAGGLERKDYLLRHEAEVSRQRHAPLPAASKRSVASSGTAPK
jgi:methylated-DNA-[protein]-cysteine S-methyltransferase